MKKDEALKIYESTREKLLAFRYINFVTDWDSTTEAPKGAAGLEASQHAEIAGMLYEINTSQFFMEAVNVLFEEREQLSDEVLKHEVTELHKDIEELLKIPKEEYTAYRKLIANSYHVYVEAKRNDDFKSFCPYLEKIVDYNRKLTEYLATDTKKGYDVLLDRYEPNMTTKEYDTFFALIRDQIVPLAKEINDHPFTDDFSFGNLSFPIAKQKDFCEHLRDVMCVDKNYSIMRESEHPFTAGFGTDDVRITNHYHEHDFVSAIFSAIHESGHGLYMAQVDKKLNHTLSTDGASMAMHESQSRFYENMIARSRVFWQAQLPKLKEFFPEQLSPVDLDLFMRFINQSRFSFVRTEADELTYPLHIMLRYDIEKGLIDGTNPVKDLPEIWREKSREYFGIVPPTDTLGVLQDVHWSQGSIGYFPTYALGSAYAAQFYAKMSETVDVDAVLLKGSTREINDWLKDKIHRFGSSKYPKEIIRYAVGSDFDPHYYVDYLTKKYSTLYEIRESFI